MKTKDQIIEELSAKIAERVKKIKEQGQDPNTDSAVQKMLDELLEARREKDKELNAQRTGDAFNTDADPEKTFDSGKYNPYALSTPVSKMLMPHDKLKRIFPQPVADAIEEFKELNDQLYLVGVLMAAKENISYADAVRRSKTYQVVRHRLETDSELRKALYTTGTGAGAEWIPTGFSSQLLEKIRLELRVASQFVTINMPTNPYKFPVQSSGASAYLIPEATTDNPSKFAVTNPGTANFEFVAKKIGARIPFSEELNEDSIVNMLDFARTELAIAIAEGLENAILNGDDSATHMDADVTASNDVRKAFKGLRYFALNNAGTSTLNFGGSAPTTALLRNLRKLLGKYGVNPKNLVFVVSPSEYIKFLDIPEVQTMDKIGSQATILNGQLGAFDGIPLLVSEFVREDLNASGVYDGTTTTQTVVYLFDKRGFMVGQRGGVTITPFRDVETDQISVIAKYRVAFKDPYDATNANNIQSVLGINAGY